MIPLEAGTIVERSLVEQDGVTYALLDGADGRRLAIQGPRGCARGFDVESVRSSEGTEVSLVRITPANAEGLRRVLPFAAPRPLGSAAITIGLGDRLGLAGAGHIAAISGFRAWPVLAQQSMRELTLTGRTYADVVDAATWAVFAAGYHEPWGADGDHLKTEDQVRDARNMGCTMITADVSEQLHAVHEERSDAEVETAYRQLPGTLRAEMEGRYLSRSFPVPAGGAVTFSARQLQRVVLVYGDAVALADRLYQAATDRGGQIDFELSIDETSWPTSAQAHLFMAEETRRRGVVLSSLAPRFVGQFQKAIDYIGDLSQFEAGLSLHEAIAAAYGYRISVHSGSDKFSLFPSVGRICGSRFHLKTSGTSWLEALRVVAAIDPALFSKVYSLALPSFPAARALYHVTPDLSALPDARALDPAAGLRLLDDVNARRVLHITYGAILDQADLKGRIFALLQANASRYEQALRSHIGRHLASLGVPLRENQ
jgi:hypothetical protein